MRVKSGTAIIPIFIPLNRDRIKKENRMSERDAKTYARLKLGDKEALAQLYDQYSKLLYSFSFKMMNDQQVAEEIVQEVFIKIWTQKKCIR
ncbi:RNA polymerase sigma factor [Geomicrobium sp. JCM 19055]|uniref:RNA polymerase sigma factor n=1 Tax=Geomicrobium sp. JCM 19055 TaxID=1460649 RepID=UPI00045ECDA0|nr:RNA polymerase sigma-70 factor [Geomicrobium sp. JCM 19055]